MNSSSIQAATSAINKKTAFLARARKDFIRNKAVYFLVLPVVIFYIVFSYVPMYGAIIAFKEYVPAKGIFDSPWVGFAKFRDFFNSKIGRAHV